MVIIEELYFVLPIYVSNMAPVFARKINLLDYPINEKLFGSHKTYRGYVAGILASIIFFYIQLYLYRFDAIKSISLVNYNEINILLIGFLAGFGGFCAILSALSRAISNADLKGLSSPLILLLR